MELKNVNFESSVDYTTSLDNFEGPLDLLLYLVKEAQISIREIFVSKVTEQYLEYINRAENLDMEKASEYLNMAATLVELKSKSLLPKEEEIVFDDIEDFIDPQEEFFRKVEEYKLYKEASQKLKEQETTEIFFKEPEPSAADVKIVYTDFTLDGLVKAFSGLLAKLGTDAAKKEKSKAIPKEIYTVAGKIDYIRHTLLEREECKFTELFGETTNITEVVTTFQALLELLKLQYLRFEQEETYSDIKIFLREDRSEDLGEIDEYN
ncbi:MAG: segregation/condensation protein A [Clostridia bacterium]|nr:segregation/condensation protein A [Clostridia bacterium]